MSLPNLIILTALLDEYMKERKPRWEAIPSSYTNTQKARQDICTSLKTKFANVKTDDPHKAIDEWMMIIQDLGVLADASQDERTFTKLPGIFQSAIKIVAHIEDDGLFCQTLHAIRTLIIKQLTEESIYKDIFNKRVTALVAEKKVLAEDIRSKEILGSDVTSLNDRYKEKLMHLTYLNEIHSILDAKKEGLLNSLKMPSQEDSRNFLRYHININIPLCYQPNFVFIFYKQNFEPVTQKDFATFIKSARVAMSTELAVRAKEEKDPSLVLSEVEAAANAKLEEEFESELTQKQMTDDSDSEEGVLQPFKEATLTSVPTGKNPLRLFGQNNGTKTPDAIEASPKSEEHDVPHP